MRKMSHERVTKTSASIGAFDLLIIALVIFAQPAAASSNVNEESVMPASCQAFLSSLGVNTHVSQGYNPGSYIVPLRFIGVRNIRDGGSRLSELLLIHQQTGVKIDLLANDVNSSIDAAKVLADNGALLSLEGPNEPNNFPVIYGGQKGGGLSGSWAAVAQFQRDLYYAVKKDRLLKEFPVFQVSEGGAETDDVGLQFLVIPEGTKTQLPAGTQLADYANAHNYVSGNNVGYVDNQAWDAADPILNGAWDGLFGEYGRTWRQRFAGYSPTELETLPRVTTETGWDAASISQERTQGIVLSNMYLSQFKRGWKYTFIYELGESEGGGGNQGLFHKNWTPKLAATYIHNLTSIIADDEAAGKLSPIGYRIEGQRSTVHDLLLQKSNGVYFLVVWGEQVAGNNDVVIKLAAAAPQVNVYDVTMGKTPLQVLRNVSSVPITISDHAIIVEIR